MASEPSQGAWEYKVFRLGPSSSLHAERRLGELGAHGWELVSFQPAGEKAYPGEGTYTLKRRSSSELRP